MHSANAGKDRVANRFTPRFIHLIPGCRLSFPNSYMWYNMAQNSRIRQIVLVLLWAINHVTAPKAAQISSITQSGSLSAATHSASSR